MFGYYGHDVPDDQDYEPEPYWEPYWEPEPKPEPKPEPEPTKEERFLRACAGGDIAEVRRLLDKFNFNFTDRNFTPLHTACR